MKTRYKIIDGLVFAFLIIVYPIYALYGGYIAQSDQVLVKGLIIVTAYFLVGTAYIWFKYIRLLKRCLKAKMLKKILIIYIIIVAIIYIFNIYGVCCSYEHKFATYLSYPLGVIDLYINFIGQIQFIPNSFCLLQLIFLHILLKITYN